MMAVGAGLEIGELAGEDFFTQRTVLCCARNLPKQLKETLFK